MPAIAMGGGLRGIEIGNEPEHYPDHAVNGIDLRTPPWTQEISAGQFSAYVSALKSAALPIAGPAYAGDTTVDGVAYFWDSTFSEFLQAVGAPNLSLITFHRYPTDVCSSPKTAADLLNPSNLKTLESMFAPPLAAAQKAGVPLRLGETNSVACGGQPGVSDAAAATVWGIDWMLDAARIGIAGVNFHGDAKSHYNPVNSNVSESSYTNQVQPLYYAMYLFANAVGQQFLPVQVTSQANIRAYALTACASCPVTVFLINKDLTASGTVKLAFTTRFAAGSYLTVEAPSLDSGTVTYGGATFDPSSALLTRLPQTTAVTPAADGSVTVPLPLASAVMLTAVPGGAAATSGIKFADAASYKPALVPGSLAVAGGQNLALATQAAGVAPWPLGMAGTRVLYGSEPVPLYYASPGQIDFQVPWEAKPGTTAITLQAGPFAPVSSPVSIVAYSPGIFLLPQVSATQGAVIEGLSGRIVKPGQPAHAGDVISIYGTGLGAVDYPPPTGFPAGTNPLARTTSTPSVMIGGVPSTVLFSGLAPGDIGVYQLNVQVPQGITAGDADPLVVSIGGVTSSPLTIAIE